MIYEILDDKGKAVHSLMHTEFDMDGEPVKRVISE